MSGTLKTKIKNVTLSIFQNLTPVGIVDKKLGDNNQHRYRTAE